MARAEEAEEETVIETSKPSNFRSHSRVVVHRFNLSQKWSLVEDWVQLVGTIEKFYSKSKT